MSIIDEVIPEMHRVHLIKYLPPYSSVELKAQFYTEDEQPL